MATIIKIVMLCYLYLKIDMTQAIGCNEESSQCIKEMENHSIVQKFQKMLCPIQARFLKCWDMCTEKEKNKHYTLFLKLRGSVDLCDENIQTYSNENLEMAKCILDSSYQDYRRCSNDNDKRRRTPTKHLASNQGFINAVIYKYCVSNEEVQKQCGQDAKILLKHMKSIVLPTMDEFDSMFV